MTPNIYSFYKPLTVSKPDNLNTYIEIVTTCLGGVEFFKKKKSDIIIASLVDGLEVVEVTSFPPV